MQSILLILHVLVGACLIGLILIQHGKGADAGAAFGSGASSTVFGSQGSSSFLTKATAFLAVVFLSNSLFLAYLSSQQIRSASVMDSMSVMTEQTQAIEDAIPTDMVPVAPQDSPSDVPIIPE